MSSNVKGLIFDLGGVLLEWDSHSATGLSSEQFVTIMHTTTWHDLDRGALSLKTACEKFGEMLGVDPGVVEAALDQAQSSLAVNTSLVQTIHDLKKQDPDLKFYVMSNISKEHFAIIQTLDLPWPLFATIFASGLEGMRKPDLNFFEHVIVQTGHEPAELLLIDDTAENICAARSLGIQGLLVDSKRTHRSAVAALRNLFQDPQRRGEEFLKANAKKLHSVAEGRNDIVLKDNFSQLLIWELTGDADLIYLKYPSGEKHGDDDDDAIAATVARCELKNGHLNENGINASESKSENDTENHNGNDDDNAAALQNPSDAERGLWNYFYEAPVLTTSTFPADADTTSIAYLSLPPHVLNNITTNNKLAPIPTILDVIATNLDESGLTQTYFSSTRPRTTPEVCCNIVRLFQRFRQFAGTEPGTGAGTGAKGAGVGIDARIAKTTDWVISCLQNRACLDGSRHYTVPEAFLYFAARLYCDCVTTAEGGGEEKEGEEGEEDLKSRLEGPLRKALRERLGVSTNPLALALRVSACQLVGLGVGLNAPKEKEGETTTYARDLKLLLSWQEEDGGWPAGHFCRMGRTGVRIGNRGLTTALVMSILRAEKRG